MKPSSEAASARETSANKPTAELAAPRPEGRPLVSVDSPIFKDVKVALEAKLGHAAISVQDLLALKSGSVVKLDLKMNDLVELRLNDSLVARGEIVAVDDNFGVRIVEISQLS